MSVSESREDLVLFRRALREMTGDVDLDDMLRGSLLGMIGHDPERARIYREETAPDQAAIDLHLRGEGVDGHLTGATAFGVFVQRIAEATKWTAKELAGADRATDDLLVEGTQQGSVRVVLRAPGPREGTVPLIESETFASAALKTIARVLTNASAASDEPEGDLLAGLVAALPANARTSLRGAAEAVLKGRWEVEGTVLQRRRTEEPVVVSRIGAQRLRSAIVRHKPSMPREDVRRGYVDGLRLSQGVVYFILTEGDLRPFSAATTDQTMLDEVARLSHERDAEGRFNEVRATFDVFDAPAEVGVASRHSRVLRSLVVLGEIGRQSSLPLD